MELKDWIGIGIFAVSQILIIGKLLQWKTDIGTDVSEIKTAVKLLASTIGEIKTEMVQLATVSRERINLNDERHRDMAVDIDELRGTTNRHSKELSDLSISQGRIQERLSIRPAGA